MRITCALINESVSEYFAVPVSDIKSFRRTRQVVAARHAACWLAKKMTGKSYPEIGRHLGGRDHTTVMHACASVEARRLEIPEAAAALTELEGIITAAAGAITQLNVEIPKDVDVKLVAARLISQPLTQFTLSIEELKAMAFAILSFETPPAASVPPTEGGDLALREAAKAACGAFLKFETDRFGRGENAALEQLCAALKQLKTAVKQEVKAL
jgi:Bacterial dnaA protein helix-turn-helix